MCQLIFLESFQSSAHSVKQYSGQGCRYCEYQRSHIKARGMDSRGELMRSARCVFTPRRKIVGNLSRPPP